MPTFLEQGVLDRLRRLPAGGLSTAQALICDTLHYPPAGDLLSRAQWPERARQAVPADPLLLARYPAGDTSFDVIYAQIPLAGSGGHVRLSRTAEHMAASALLRDHPTLLLLFTDAQERCWELVSVQTGGDARPALHRIVVTPDRPLGGAAGCVARLDLASMAGPLPGTLAPAWIAQRHAEAFDADALGREFLERLAQVHGQVRDAIDVSADGVDSSAQAQALLDRLLILHFLQKGGWLGNSQTYLRDRFRAHHAAPQGRTFHRDVAYPLYHALSDLLAGMPGADLAPPHAGLPVPDDTYATLFDELFEYYDLTLDEDSLFDRTVAIGPDILGKVFESLVLPREKEGDVDKRRATGSYYTPRPVVAFMCREALAEYLASEAGLDRERAGRLLALPPEGMLAEGERQWLAGAFSGAQAQHVRRALLNVRACDAAAGSGAFLVGLLQAISAAVETLAWRVAGKAPPAGRQRGYETKRAIVEQCLHGVDLQPGAVRACALRLWLSLLAAYEPGDAAGTTAATDSHPGQAPEPGTALTLPPHLLPDLSRTLRQGDGLLERLGNGDGTPFRWRDDFRDVFEEKGGFDLMIGNPPYSARVSRGDWAEIKARYVGAARARNPAAAFLALPFDCVHEQGVACQIVPKSVTFSAGWRATRRLIWERGTLVGSADVSQAFEGVLLEQEVLIYRVRPAQEIKPRGWALRGQAFEETHRAPLAILKQHDAIMNHVPPLAGALIERLTAGCMPLGLHTITRRGAGWQAHLVAPSDAGPPTTPVIRGRDVRQFGLARPLPRIAVLPGMAHRLGAMTVPKIVSQNIIAHITQPYDTLVVISALDRAGLAALDTVNMTTPRRGCPFPVEFVVALLNSSFARWYFYFVIYNRAVRTMHLDAPYIGKLPVPAAVGAEIDTICALADNLARTQEGEGIKYFLHGHHPLYDALDEALFRLYALTDQEIGLVLRESES
ncbi:MAG: hypothetical protein JXA93_18260 [Anaerolineae bacterium]|nr:hypothetical protein [Anaerolineae bacterium]